MVSDGLLIDCMEAKWTDCHWGSIHGGQVLTIPTLKRNPQGKMRGQGGRADDYGRIIEELKPLSTLSPRTEREYTVRFLARRPVSMFSIEAAMYLAACVCRRRPGGDNQIISDFRTPGREASAPDLARHRQKEGPK